MLTSVIVQAVGVFSKPGHDGLPANTPQYAIVGYLVAVLIPFWALLQLPGTAQTVHGRLRLALDASAVAIGDGLFVYYFSRPRRKRRDFATSALGSLKGLFSRGAWLPISFVPLFVAVTPSEDFSPARLSHS